MLDIWGTFAAGMLTMFAIVRLWPLLVRGIARGAEGDSGPRDP